MNEEQIKAIEKAMIFLSIMQDYFEIDEDLKGLLNEIENRICTLQQANVPECIIDTFERHAYAFYKSQAVLVTTEKTTCE